MNHRFQSFVGQSPFCLLVNHLCWLFSHTWIHSNHSNLMLIISGANPHHLIHLCRLNPNFPYFSLRWTSYNFLGFSMLTHNFSWWNRHKSSISLAKKTPWTPHFLGLEKALRGLAAGGNGHHVGAPGGRVTTTTSCAATVTDHGTHPWGSSPTKIGI